MKVEVTCVHCHTELRIQENLFFFAHAESREKAVCVSCNTVVLESTIKGWYFVEDAKKSDEKAEKECTYPMP
jgi:hypothetical protein